MKRPRAFILFWTVVIAALLFIEVAELTHLFTIPFLAAVSDPVTFALALIFVTIVALVGAIFIGIYVSQRLLSPRGFSPFEEEMLKMRAEVMEIRRETQEMLERLGVPDGKNPSPPRAAAAPGDPPEDRP
jgi:membrane protein implicated in regulation of membrane protease activity